jgi:glutathione S-transferase
MIDVYTADTPNGVKIPIALEEIGAHYRIIRVKLSEGEQKQPEFLALNPNGRIPVVVDEEGPDGQPLSVFESGAILLYLADKFGKLIPADPVGRVRALEWLFFQHGGVGPMFGQSGVFRRREEKIPFALERYESESQRLVGVLETRLSEVPYLAGDDVSIADVAHFGWLDVAESYAGVEITPAVSRWREALRARTGFQRGIAAVRF